MGKYLDLSGMKFNRITVIRKGERAKDGRIRWVCKCECSEREFMVSTSHLKSGHTKSCGCYDLERKTTHGLSKTRIYKIWNGIIERCTNKNDTAYHYYGDRGIKICSEWLDFLSFYNWSIENGYDDKSEIDRIDNNYNYDPSNCAWVSRSKNMEIGKRRMHKNNKSGINGVWYDNGIKKWIAGISKNGKNINLGSFKSKKEAFEARTKKEIEFFGEQRTNIGVCL